MDESTRDYEFFVNAFNSFVVMNIFRCKFIGIFSVLLLAEMFISCHSNHHRSSLLVEADSLLPVNPSKALAKIDSFSRSKDIADKEDSMYCRLLRLSALDKLYITHQELNEVQEMIAYFREQDDRDLLPRAYYILGRELADMHDVPQALTYYHKVLECLDEKENLRLRGRVNSQIGYIMNDLEDLKQAIYFFQESYHCDSIIGNQKTMVMTLRDIARTKRFLGEQQEAFRLYMKALKLAEKIKASDLINDVKVQLAEAFIYDGVKLDSVWKYLAPSLACGIRKADVPTCLVASEYYWAKEKDDSVRASLLRVSSIGDEYDKKEAWRRLLILASETRDMDAAYKYFDRFVDYSDSVDTRREKERKENGLALFNYVSHKEQILRLEDVNQKKNLLFFGLSFLLVVIIFLFYFYHQMSIVRKLKIKNKITDLKMHYIYKSHLQKPEKPLLNVNLEQYIEEGRHLPTSVWTQLDEAVNLQSIGFKDILYSFCQLSELEYHICLLVKIGVGTKHIALFTDRTPQSISMAKQRLYKKITKEKGRADNLDMFLKSL